AYILFILQNGWIHLAMWIILALVVGYKGIQLLGKANTPSERIPVAAALAGTIAIFFAMYTVFYGFVYAVLFCVMIGMLGTMTQLFSQRYASAVPVAGARGFAPVSHGALAHAGGRR
ncbi:MAG TPA: hypothetical protein VGB55_08230, partial [Tepidisphaeraceae bacterium]